MSSIFDKENRKKIGIYCGSFDPVHNMHLNFANYVFTSYQMNEIRFIPHFQSVSQNLKSIKTSIDHRLNMLQIATANFPYFIVDTRNIETKRPVTALETLQNMRLDYPNAILIFMISSDVALSMVNWDNWEELINYANIFINIRLGCLTLTKADKLNAFIQAHRVNNMKELTQTTHGKMIAYPVPKQIAISSSMIRSRLANHESVEKFLPASVYQYIMDHHIY